MLQSDLPLNDGGMFYVMTQNLIANGFHLPATTSYNHLNLPFAYPPLAFYLAGLLVKLTSWDLLDIIRILPAIFTILSIPAFFMLVRALVSNKFQVIFATMMFAFIPASFDWLIMGGWINPLTRLFLLVNFADFYLQIVHPEPGEKYCLDGCLFLADNSYPPGSSPAYPGWCPGVFCLFWQGQKGCD